MKKIVCLFLMLAASVFAQDITQKEDIRLNSSSGVDIGAGLGSSGKVKESISIASIASRSVSYDVTFNYDGTNVFKQAQYQNRYFPTGSLGVGWSIGVPKIVADTKQTASRDDDTFYLNGVELICTDRPSHNNDVTGFKTWGFQTKNQKNPVVIKYYESNIWSFGHSWTVTPLDYWEVIDDKGRTYVYGNSDNSRESVLAWGNWIGDSKEDSGSVLHTTAWNLSQLKDQWGNYLNFTYFEVEQGVNASSIKATEASYLKQIDSKTGEKIVFNYTTKTADEYYEPHTEMAEPDAYQERYEKHYLDRVDYYNSAGSLVTSTALNYQLATASGVENTKRYLTGIIKNNAVNTNLGSQKFEYNTAGNFAGTLKTKTNLKGGSVTYSYNQNFLFKNDNETIRVINPLEKLYFAQYQSDTYKLELYSQDYLTTYNANRDTPWVNFNINRYDWNGRKWIESSFNIPESIRLMSFSGGWDFQTDNVRFVFDDDFYAMLIFKRGAKTGNLYLFHRLPDGTWDYTLKSNLSTGGVSDDDFSQDPVLLNGDGFVAIGTARTGRLFTYVWNGLSWNERIIYQNNGLFCYEANNNFILTLDYNTGVDMASMDPQDPQSHYDKYYIHFLDADKKWQTRSSTAFCTSNIGDVSGNSFFYPNNAMSSFVASNNPEYILRWDSDYRINHADNVLGAFNDSNLYQSVGKNLFAEYVIAGTGRPYAVKAVAVSGLNNYASPNLNSDQQLCTQRGFGENRLLGLRWLGTAYNYEHTLWTFNPNTSSWISNDLAFTSFSDMAGYAFASDLFLAGKQIYKLNNNGFSSMSPMSFYDHTDFSISGGDYIYGSFRSVINGSNYGETSYSYIDKVDGLQRVFALEGLKNYGNTARNVNYRCSGFGGKYPLATRKNLEGKKLIDNRLGNDIYDIVVNQVAVDNGAGQVSIVKYTFENSNTLIDDATVIYGKVTTEEIGAGTSSNGKTIKYYDNGASDFSSAGLITKEEYYDKLSTKLKEINYSYTSKAFDIKTLYSYPDAIWNFNRWEKTNVEEKVMFGANTLVTNTSYTYDNNGNLLQTCRLDSKGNNECTTITYAETDYSFVQAANLIGFMRKKINKINNNVVSAEQINWVQNGGKVYIKENLSGVNESLLRVNNQIDVVDSYGNVVETSNGKGLSKAVLMGYNYKYPVATIVNARQADVIAALGTTYTALQSLTGDNLKTELLKIYSNLPASAMISLSIYDDNGNIVKSIDGRKNETNFIYDEFQRTKYVTDKNNKIVKQKKYEYANLMTCAQSITISIPVTSSQDFQVRDTITASSPINSNLSVNFKGNRIILQPGFSAGSGFNAIVDPCD